MIEQGYDAIMVVPVDTAAMGPITDAVTAAGIPLIYINRNPFGTENPPEGVYYCRLAGNRCRSASGPVPR